MQHYRKRNSTISLIVGSQSVIPYIRRRCTILQIMFPMLVVKFVFLFRWLTVSGIKLQMKHLHCLFRLRVSTSVARKASHVFITFATCLTNIFLHISMCIHMVFQVRVILSTNCTSLHADDLFFSLYVVCKKILGGESLSTSCADKVFRTSMFRRPVSDKMILILNK